jgi:hypothetical protein
MKQIIFHFLIILAAIPFSYSQELFPSDNAQWIEAVIFYNRDGSVRNESYCSYSLQKDTLIENIYRSKLYFTPDINRNYSELIGYIHTNGGKVYLRQEETGSTVFQWKESIDEDIVMYDFTLDINDLFFPLEINTYGPHYKVENIDFVLLGTEERRELSLSADFSSLKYDWIEGMGSTRRFLETRERLTYELIYGRDWDLLPLFPSNEEVYEKRLVCFYQDDKILWQDADYRQSLSNDIPIKTSSINIFSSPADDRPLIVSSIPLQQIQIYDARGILRSNDKADGKFQYPVYNQSLSAGIYYVKVRFQNGQSETKRIIIQ